MKILPEKENVPIRFVLKTSLTVMNGWFHNGYFYRGEIVIEGNGEHILSRPIGKYAPNTVFYWEYTPELKVTSVRCPQCQKIKAVLKIVHEEKSEYEPELIHVNGPLQCFACGYSTDFMSITGSIDGKRAAAVKRRNKKE